jgi:predicted transcriptional regulator
MTVNEVASRCGFEVVCGARSLGREVRGGYASDMLSDVLAHAAPGAIWVTLQTHANIVAVAAMREQAAIVLVRGRRPEPDTVAKANAIDMPILASRLPAFDTVVLLSSLGLAGTAGDGAGI